MAGPPVRWGASSTLANERQVTSADTPFNPKTTISIPSTIPVRKITHIPTARLVSPRPRCTIVTATGKGEHKCLQSKPPPTTKPSTPTEPSAQAVGPVLPTDPTTDTVPVIYKGTRQRSATYEPWARAQGVRVPAPRKRSACAAYSFEFARTLVAWLQSANALAASATGHAKRHWRAHSSRIDLALIRHRSGIDLALLWPRRGARMGILRMLDEIPA